MLRDLDTYGDELESRLVVAEVTHTALYWCRAFHGGGRRGVDVEMSMWWSLSPSLAARLFRSGGSIWTDRSESSRPDFELQSAGSKMRFEMKS